MRRLSLVELDVVEGNCFQLFGCVVKFRIMSLSLLKKYDVVYKV